LRVRVVDGPWVVVAVYTSVTSTGHEIYVAGPRIWGL